MDRDAWRVLAMIWLVAPLWAFTDRLSDALGFGLPLWCLLIGGVTVPAAWIILRLKLVERLVP